MFSVLSFILGAIVGSFLNVCIYRLPRKISLIKPGSFCPHCQQKIKPIFNIPILSFLFLKGRCAYCRGKISLLYPLVEIITASSFLGSFKYFGFSLDFLKAIVFISLLIAVTFIDWQHQIIPDKISLPGIVVGLFFSIFAPKREIIGSIGGVLAGGGLLYLFALLSTWLFHKEGMGGGDIKLAGTIGAFLGWGGVLLTISLASITGTFVSLILISLKKKKWGEVIPFGPFLCLSAVIVLFFKNFLLSLLLGA